MMDTVFRHEHKYIIRSRDHLLLRQRLKVLLRPDLHAAQNGDYHVRSLYFDDPDSRCVAEKVDGLLGRRKYRVRIYNYSDSLIKLECKYRRDRYIAKETAVLSRQQFEAIMAGDIGFLKQARSRLKQHFYLLLRHRRFAPVTVVNYLREAYTASYQRLRITFDKHLKAQPAHDLFVPNRPAIAVLEPGRMVMEVKYLRFFPDHLKQILALPDTSARSVSKYVLCRTAL